MKKDIILFVSIFSVLLLLAGGTYAYWSWQSNTDKDVVFNTINGVEDYIVYNPGDSHFVGDFQPYDTFCESISTTVSVYKKSEVFDIKFTATIHMDINAIESPISSSDSVYWVVTRGGNNISCSNGLNSSSVISYGTFKGKSAGNTFALTNNVELEISTTEKEYTVWIWIDSSGSNLTSLTGKTLDTNIWTQIDMLDNKNSDKESAVGDAYAVYSADDTSLRFYRSEIPIEEGSTYNGLTVTAVYTGIEEDNYTSLTAVPWNSYKSSITNVVFEDEIAPISTDHWFRNIKSNFNLIKLNTSNVTSMAAMFTNAGGISGGDLTLDLSSWDVSNVTNMSGMFSLMATSVTNLSLDLSGWDMSSVTNVDQMFRGTGSSATTINLDLSDWDLSSLTTTISGSYGMFQQLGTSATNVSIDVSGWNTSNITNMSKMFYSTGENSSIEIIGLNTWDVSNVTNMNSMFTYSGRLSETYSIGNLSGWITSNVTDMGSMFAGVGAIATNNWTLDLSNWNVCKVTKYTDFAAIDKITLPNFGMSCPT